MSTFITIDGDRGFWMRTGVLSLSLRLLALHVPEPGDAATPSARAAAATLRDHWLLSSRVHYHGLLPGRPGSEGIVAAALEATRSLVAALGRHPDPLSAATLNLLGFGDALFTRDVPSEALAEVGRAFAALFDGRVASRATDDAWVPESRPAG